MFRVSQLRSIVRTLSVSCLAAGLTVGCASTTPVTSGGYYCLKGTQQSCSQHEAYGDCQLCPPSSIAAASGTNPWR